MLDDFFSRAILAGVGLACVAGPLGCIVVWRRLAYFGDTLAHGALLGIAIGLLLEINATIAVLLSSAGLATALLVLQARGALPSDALLGLLSHACLALGLVALSMMTWVNVDLVGLLFGDILAVSREDIAIIYAGGAAILAVLASQWRGLFAATVSPELAAAENLSPARNTLIFTLLLATVIAIAMKLVGVLLMTALLIIPAACARLISGTPELMALLASALGAVSVLLGLYSSLYLDTPSGPSIVVAALIVFCTLLLATSIAGLVRDWRAKTAGPRRASVRDTAPHGGGNG
ncbi:MAG: metal ABC transporter permease [Pseudomonadota bacterium]